MKGTDEKREKDSDPQAKRLQSNTGLQCHTLQNPQPSLCCNTEHNPQKQETGNCFLMKTTPCLSNVGSDQLTQSGQGWLKEWGVTEFSGMYLGLVEKQ